eukprot:gene13945-32502_t
MSRRLSSFPNVVDDGPAKRRLSIPSQSLGGVGSFAGPSAEATIMSEEQKRTLVEEGCIVEGSPPASSPSHSAAYHLPSFTLPPSSSSSSHTTSAPNATAAAAAAAAATTTTTTSTPAVAPNTSPICAEEAPRITGGVVHEAYASVIHFLRRSTLRTLQLPEPEADSDAWSHETEAQLQKALCNGQRQDLVCLASPAGGGKTKLLRSVLESSQNTLLIDLKQESKLSHHATDLDFAKMLIDSVGYSPSMLPLHELREKVEQLVVVASRGTIKPSVSAVTLMAHVLGCTAEALAWHAAVHESGNASGSNASAVGNGNGNAAAAEAAALAAKQRNMEAPIIAINGLTTLFQHDHAELSELILEWAKLMIANKLANVVIATDSTFADAVCESGDIVPATVIKLKPISIVRTMAILKAELHPSTYGGETDVLASSAAAIGGSVADLRAIVHKVKHTGVPLDEAVRESVLQCVMELRSRALGLGTKAEQPWGKAQVWHLMTELALHGVVEHDRVLFSQLFAGDEAPLRSMERAGLISVVRVRHTGENALPSEALAASSSKVATGAELYITPGRPIYRAAFKMLKDDPVLGGGMKLVVIKQLAEKEQTRLKEYELELATLTGVVSANAAARAEMSWFWRQPAVTQLNPRTQHLAEAVAASNLVLEDLVKQRQHIEAGLDQSNADSDSDAALLLGGNGSLVVGGGKAAICSIL